MGQPWHNADWWDMFTPEPGVDRTRYDRAAAAMAGLADRLHAAILSKRYTDINGIMDEFSRVQDEYSDLGAADTEPSMAIAEVVRLADPSLDEIIWKVRWWTISERIARIASRLVKVGAPSLTAYHGTAWNLLTSDWFETLNPLEVCRALEFSEDIETARGRCLDSRDFNRGEVEVIFRAKIDLDKAERHGDEIWVLDPTAVSEQQARAVVGDDRWTDWMDSRNLWVHLLGANGLLPPPDAIPSALSAGYNRLG